MPRTKRLIRVPFLKFKINKQTIFNILGFILVACALILLVSFIKDFVSTPADGILLNPVNNILIEKVGVLSIFLPFLIFLFAAHFFNTKKLRFVKPNISFGLLLVFIALLGITQSGQFGQLIFSNLSADLTQAGAIIILAATFLIGLILFLDTSIDVFLLFVIDIVKGVFSFFKNYFFRSAGEVEKGKEKSRAKEEFILEKKPFEKKDLPVLAGSPTAKPITIRPISASSKSTWVYPPLSLLTDVAQEKADRGDVNGNAGKIERTLDSFGIRAKVADVNYGPTVTQYALSITMGTKLSRITALSNDLALALAAPTGQVRIEAPIPGRSMVGIEIPNIKPEIVTLKKLLADQTMISSNDPLLVPLGLDVAGKPQAASIDKMPHVLIAGTTGSGKSVILNAWISTFLFRVRPEDLRLILVDPKRVELTAYNGIPHLLTEVVVEPERIISALRWTVLEMENRYKEFAKVGARNIESFNLTPGVEKKPYIIFVIDELADLMIFAPGDAEDLITRIAQMARATGIHLILATQRPSVDVITGLMKANIPCRIAFNVSSMIDSRVIIDMPGAEKLLGKGDMLFLPPDQAKPRRIQGPFITEKEVNQLVKFLKTQTPEVHYTEEITTQDINFVPGRGGTMVVASDEKDPYFNQVVEVISQMDKASSSLLQRKFKIGYSRAARLLDQLEAEGYVGPAEGSKPREVLRRSAQVETPQE